MKKVKGSFPYIGFLLFALTFLFSSVYLINRKDLSFPIHGKGESSQMWLLPTQLELNKNKEETVRVFLVSKERVVGGVDLVLKYDNDLIEVVDNTIKLGSIFNYYRDRLVDNRRGVIRLSSLGKFKGEGTFATFIIKGKKEGEGKIEIITQKASQDATFIWDEEEKENILGKTYDLYFRVN